MTIRIAKDSRGHGGRGTMVIIDKKKYNRKKKHKNLED